MGDCVKFCKHWTPEVSALKLPVDVLLTVCVV